MDERKNCVMSEKIKRLKRELKYKGAIVEFLSGYDGDRRHSYGHIREFLSVIKRGLQAVVPVTEDGKNSDGAPISKCTGTLYTGGSGRRAGCGR